MVTLLMFVGGILFTFLAIAGTIFIHEFGHFSAAKACKLPITEFSIGFGRVLWERTINGTIYRIRAIILGGYVQIPSLDSPEVKLKHRVAVILSGPFSNLVLALTIATILSISGRPTFNHWDTLVVGYVDQAVEIDRRMESSPGYLAGFNAGDSILAVNGKVTSGWIDMLRLVQTSTQTINGKSQVVFSVMREGKVINLSLNPILVQGKGRILGIHPAEKLSLSYLDPQSLAYKAGLRKGDTLATINSSPVLSRVDIGRSKIANYDYISIGVMRNGNIHVFKLPFGLWDPLVELPVQSVQSTRYDNPLTVIGQSVSSAANVMTALIDPRSAISLSDFSGPIGMSTTLHSLFKFDIRLALWLVMVLNINLLVVNLIPVPMLDGGQVLIAIARKFIGGEKFDLALKYTNHAGVVAVLAVFVYITALDLGRILLGI